MTIRRKTRKHGGGEREKLFAWVDYVLDHANKNGWPAFSIIEERTNNSGNTNEVEVEIESSIKDNGKHVFPTSHRPMSDEYATGLAMYYWDPQRKTGANRALYKHFESQYQNKPSARSHSPVRRSNIKELGLQLGQQLNEVQEQFRASLASSSAANAAASSIQPARAPIANRGANNNARIQALALKLHTEQSDARELKELQKKLNETSIAKWIQQRMTSPRNLNNKLIKQITKNEEVVLYVTFLRCGSITSHVRGDGDLYTPSFNISLIITNRNVYFVRIHRESYKTEHDVGLTSGLHYMSVYTFDKPLNLKQTKMLSILTSNTDYREEDYDEPILRHDNTVSILAGLNQTMGGGRGEMAYRMFPYLEAKKEFESVIRAIPGSYKNKNWRPLDGFFGLYLNETTMEINEFPGEILEASHDF